MLADHALSWWELPTLEREVAAKPERARPRGNVRSADPEALRVDRAAVRQLDALTRGWGWSRKVDDA